MDKSKIAWALFGPVATIYGIPGLLEDSHVWAQWFSGWQWHNLLLVFGGIAMFLYGTSDLWIRAFAQGMQTPKEGGSDTILRIILSPVLYPVKWWLKFVKWANTGEEDDPLTYVKLAILIMVGCALFPIVFVIVTSPLWLLLALLESLSASS